MTQGEDEIESSATNETDPATQATSSGAPKRQTLRPKGYALKKRAERGYLSQMKTARRILIIVAIILAAVTAFVFDGHDSLVEQLARDQKFLKDSIEGTPEWMIDPELVAAEKLKLKVRQHILDNQKYAFFLNIGLAVLFLNLFFMAKSKPALACQIALIAYIVCVIIGFVLDPTFLLSAPGWLIKIVIAVTLARGVKAANAFEKLKAQSEEEEFKSAS